MVTLLELTDDDERLIDAFRCLLPESQGEVLRRLSVAACYAAMLRSNPGRVGSKTPDVVAAEFLCRCMPSLPGGYEDEFGFRYRYLDRAYPRVEWRAIEIVFGPAKFDHANAKDLAEVLTECAMDIASDFCAPDFSEGGFVGVEQMVAYIQKWRESFTSNFARLHSTPDT